MHNSGVDGTHGTNRRRYFEIVPADGHYGCQLEETKTSVRRRFLGSSSDKSMPAFITIMGMPEIKDNRSHPLLCRGSHMADLVYPDPVSYTHLDVYKRQLKKLSLRKSRPGADAFRPGTSG